MGHNSVPFLTCESLVKIYQLDGVEILALQGLDLTVEQGELLGIVGASGSGKSTLLNLLGGLDRPSAGQVQVAGRDLLKLSDRELDRYRREQVGFVWQQTTRNLIPYLNAQENVELPMQLLGLPKAERQARALKLLDSLGLKDLIQRRSVQLSGGEQQRVAIAVALANQPALLLADEPTGEVDMATAREVYAALRHMNALLGMTIIIVSHDPDLNRFTDRIVAIRDGKTSTEMIRTPSRPKLDRSKVEYREVMPGERVSAEERGEFEELVVLDKAGRLQIPRPVMEALNIGDRVRLEVREGSVLIHPVAGRGRTPEQDEGGAAPEKVDPEGNLEPEETHTRRFGFVRQIVRRVGWMNRFRR